MMAFVAASFRTFRLLSQVGETTGSQPQPIYRFDVATQHYVAENVDSFYQIQLALRYSF